MQQANCFAISAEPEQNRCDDFSARSQRGAKRKPWSRRALGAAEQTKQKRAIGGIDGLQPVFYGLTAAPIEHEREMASHGARAGLLIEPIEHINVVPMRTHALLADAVSRYSYPHIPRYRSGTGW